MRIPSKTAMESALFEYLRRWPPAPQLNMSTPSRPAKACDLPRGKEEANIDGGLDAAEERYYNRTSCEPESVSGSEQAEHVD